MKQLSILLILLILLFATSIASAQQAGQLYITSYNDTVDIGYVCHGVGHDTVSFGMGAINWIPSVPITIDSFTFHVKPESDTVNFQYLESATNSIKLGKGAWYGSGPNWVAQRVGDDTFIIIGYYNGQFTDTAHLIFHARNSPDLSMYGITSNLIDVGGGNKIGAGIALEEETDTMHDKMANEPYTVSTTPEGTGMSNNIVTLRSCGGAVMDSINESGDFSEFAFDQFPQLPYTFKEEDSLVLHYLFTPQIVDEQGLRHHYLIFHTTDGHYLTWSFEYKVYPNSSVSVISESANDLRVFPNPARDALQVLGGPSGTARLFDLLGRERAESQDDGSVADGDVRTTRLDISHIEAGIYFLRIGNQSAKVEIAH